MQLHPAPSGGKRRAFSGFDFEQSKVWVKNAGSREQTGGSQNNGINQ